LLFFLISLNIYSQNSFYVSSKQGNDTSGDGSLSNPYKTLTKAVSVISGGDIIYLREGVYHESVSISNINGTSNNKTTITNYQNELVIIDGTVWIDGTWQDDNENSSIKYLSNVTQDITQLFVGSNQMVMARWPNAQFTDNSIFDHDNWAHGDEDNSTDGNFYIDETYDDPGSIDLSGTIGILNVGSFKTFNRTISNHTQQSGNDLIQFTDDIGTKGIGASLSSNSPLKNKHHYFFFEGKKELIDTQNEWFLNTSSDILYLYPPNGVDLTSTFVRGKVRDYSITVSNSDYLKIEGLTFFATTLKIDSSDYVEINENNFYYPSHSKRMLGDLNGANPTTIGSSQSNSVNYSIIDSCLFINTEGEGLIINGDNNEVKNSYFKNIDWSATELDGLMVTINIDGTSNQFNNNEIYRTGASATVWPGESSVFSFNIVSNTGLAQSDGAVFQGTKNTVSGSIVNNNFVYDTEKYAFRYDAPGGDATSAGSYGIMHHNIADNTMGLMIKGNNQIIANNTVINTISNRNDIIILAEDCSNNNTWLYNNLAGRIGSHRSSQDFSTPNDGPIPIGTTGYILDDNNTSNDSDDFWRDCQNGDLGSGWVISNGNGSSQSNIDQINVSRAGISYNSDVESLISYDSSNGKTIADYTPTSSTLIDSGVAPTDLVSRPTGSDNLNNIVPQTSVGAAPDIGAIDSNYSWTPGIDWTPVESFDFTSYYDIVDAIDYVSNTTITSDENFMNVTVSNGVVITIASDGSLRAANVLNNNGSIVMNSSSNEFSSLIAGSKAGSGTYTYNRYVSGNSTFDLISAPFTGQSFSSLISNNSGVIFDTSASVNQYLFGHFNNSDGVYESYINDGSNEASTTLDAGLGFRTGTDSGATLAFTGTFETSNVTEPISLGSDATYGRWNLIGNPFPSYLDLNHFFTDNSGILDTNYAAIYAYDGDDSDGSVWTTYNTSTLTDGNGDPIQKYIAPGQAFFVASSSSTEQDITFATDMQSTAGTDDFLPGERRPNDDSFAQNASSSNSKISLALSFDDSKYAATDIYLNTKASSGLDVGYDAGTFANQAGSLGLYSFLADGSHPETKLAIQAVSNNITKPIVIPLGVNAQSGIDYTIKLKERPQQEGVFVYLKDNLDNSMTLLTDQDYNFNTSTDLQGDGRFEVHLSAFALSTFDISKAPYSMIGLNGRVQVTGELSKGDVITILDLRGRTLAKQTVNSPTQSATVQLNGVSKGVYIGKVENNIGQYNTKFILK